MNKGIFPNMNYTFNNQNLLNDLPSAISNLLFKHSTTLHFKAGEHIFEEGSMPDGIYRILSGKVKKSTLTTFGTEHIFYICKELDYLGYHALLSDESHSDSAAALTDCEIAFINKVEFLKALEKSHLLAQRLLKNLSHEFVVYINATKALAKYTVRERTALNLLILQDKFGEEAVAKTSITISRMDLANMVGTAKESVVRMLKDFKEERLISTKGSTIIIENYQGLVQVSNFS